MQIQKRQQKIGPFYFDRALALFNSILVLLMNLHKVSKDPYLPFQHYEKKVTKLV